MLVDRITPAQTADGPLEVVVVIDVLRATTTAVVLLAREAPAVRVVAAPRELASLPPALPSAPYLVFSELAESSTGAFECVDNSPAVAETIELAGRRPVLVTTNGTRAIDAVRSARLVLVAGFVNLSSTVRHLQARGDARVTLLPAGDFASGDPRTEDERCADALEGMLRGGAPDLASLVTDCWQDARVKRRLARTPALLRDVEISLHVDRHEVVAAAVPVAGGVELVRV